MTTLSEIKARYAEHKFKLPPVLHDLDPNTKVKDVLSKVEPLDAEKMQSSEWWNIRGIGPVTALKLWQDGMRPENIRHWIPKLPLQTQMWLLYKPLAKIPLESVDGIVRQFMPPDLKEWQIVGSYRRQRPTVGDIDILFWGPDIEILMTYLEQKHGKSWYVYQRGPSKIGGMFHMKDYTVEVDIWLANPDNLHAMLLYSTGSKEWNIYMRRRAKKKGLKLNQYGLFKDEELLPTKTEADIFAALDIPYRDPKDR